MFHNFNFRYMFSDVLTMLFDSGALEESFLSAYQALD